MLTKLRRDILHKKITQPVSLLPRMCTEKQTAAAVYQTARIVNRYIYGLEVEIWPSEQVANLLPQTLCFWLLKEPNVSQD